jgi:hypothetical protein
MLGEIDHQINLDLGGRSNRALYAAARDEGSPPLVETAARTLSEAVSPGEHVLLTTGFPILPVERPETDGPPGTVVLAAALETLEARPVVVTEPDPAGPVRAAAETLGVDVPVETVAPADGSAARVDELVAQYDPAAVVAIEKPGRTADGSYRSMNGAAVTDLVGEFDRLVERAHETGVPTVAVGDGGNEIGMGGARLRAAVAEHVPHGGTIACETAVDAPVVAGVSNWGAYGIVCGLSRLTGAPLLHDRATERELIAACVEAGAVDAISGEPERTVDGLPAAVHADVVALLNDALAVADRDSK